MPDLLVIDRNPMLEDLRVDWASGEWDNEPDKIVFTDDVTGRPCIVWRNGFGNLNGYVGVRRGERFFGEDYDAVPVLAHFGLTYSGPDAATNPEEATYEVSHPTEPGQWWWFGFDCAHYQDIVPHFLQLLAKRHELAGIAAAHTHQTYKNVAYVKSHCASIALQLAVDLDPEE